MRAVRGSPVLPESFDCKGRPKYEVYNYLIGGSTLAIETVVDLSTNLLAGSMVSEIDGMAKVLGRKLKPHMSKGDLDEVSVYMDRICINLAKEMQNKGITSLR